MLKLHSCLATYTYIYIHTHIHTHICTCMHSYIQSCMHADLTTISHSAIFTQTHTININSGVIVIRPVHLSHPLIVGLQLPLSSLPPSLPDHTVGGRLVLSIKVAQTEKSSGTDSALLTSSLTSSSSTSSSKSFPGSGGTGLSEPHDRNTSTKGLVVAVKSQRWVPPTARENLDPTELRFRKIRG